MPASPNQRRRPRGGLSSLLLVLGLTWLPACTKEPVSAPLTDPARGSDYVASPQGPAAVAPRSDAPPRILAADVGGEHDDLVEGERMRAEYDPGDPWLGALQPAVTIVAFVDYQCPFSKRLVPTLYELAELYPDDLRVVFKHHPLPMHADARFAAMAAVAAMQQGRFWVMNDALFESQADLGRTAVLGQAARLGFDLPRFEASLDDAGVAARVDADAAQAERLGARGTPSMFINGRLVTGARPLADLRKAQKLDPLKGTKAASGIIGTYLGPRSPGTAYVLLHHYMGEIDGAFRAWGFAKNGTGGVSAAIARSARALGVEARPALPDLEEDLLLDVLRGAAVAERAPEERERRAPVLLVDAGKRRRVAPAQALEAPPLRPAGSARTDLHRRNSDGCAPDVTGEWVGEGDGRHAGAYAAAAASGWRNRGPQRNSAPRRGFPTKSRRALG